MESVVVIIAVALAGIWAAARIAGKLRGGVAGADCGAGCGGCGCSATAGRAAPGREGGLVAIGSRGQGERGDPGAEVPRR